MSVVCSSKLDDLCRLEIAPEPVPTAIPVPDSPASASAVPAHTSTQSISDSVEGATQPASDGPVGNVSTQPTEAAAEDDEDVARNDEHIYGSDYENASDSICSYDHYLGNNADFDSDKDFTACSIECGYCGHCDY